MALQTASQENEAATDKGAATRTRILHAACRLFSERGYDGTGIREVESAAEVNRGVATYHFKNKETLWKAAVEHTFAPHLADMKSKADLLKAMDPATRQQQLIRYLVVISAQHPYLNQLMIQESLAKTWRIDWIIERFLKPIQQMRREILAGDPLGEELDTNPHLHYALLGASALVFSLRTEAEALYGANPFDEAFVERHVEMVTSLFANVTSRTST